MPRGDSLHLQILRRVAGQLKHLSGEVLKDGRAVDSRGGSNPSRGEGPALQMTMDPADRELESSPGAPRNRLLLHLSRVLSCLSSGHLERFSRESEGDSNKFASATKRREYIRCNIGVHDGLLFPLPSGILFVQ